MKNGSKRVDCVVMLIRRSVRCAARLFVAALLCIHVLSVFGFSRMLWVTSVGRNALTVQMRNVVIQIQYGRFADEQTARDYKADVIRWPGSPSWPMWGNGITTSEYVSTSGYVPVKGLWASFPASLLLVVAAPLVCQRLSGRKKTTPTNCCRFCGYNLSGLIEQRCPECGSMFEVHHGNEKKGKGKGDDSTDS